MDEFTNYQGKYTGADIDDAVERVMQGRIPDGVGVAAKDLSNVDNKDMLAKMEASGFTGGSNPNLIDGNWYFADPIDQRGGYIVPPNVWYYDTPTFNVGFSTTVEYYPATKVSNTAYSITLNNEGRTVVYVHAEDVVRGYIGPGYSIDRWKLLAGAVVLTENGVNIKKYEQSNR